MKRFFSILCIVFLFACNTLEFTVTTEGNTKAQDTIDSFSPSPSQSSPVQPGKRSILLITSEEEMQSILSGPKGQEPITDLIIQNVERIPDGAFSEWTSLCRLTLSDSIMEIGHHVFENCSNLVSIEWSERVLTIGDCSFARTAITDLTLPASVKSIGYYAFSHCDCLQTVVLPDALEDLKTAFIHCPELTSIQLPKGLKWLDAEMVSACKKLQTLIIPASVEVVDSCVGDQSGLRQYIFEGQPDAVCCLVGDQIPCLERLVFLSGPPHQEEVLIEDAYPENYGILNKSDGSVVIYYLNKNAHDWCPNGETTWGGFQLIGIDSLDELPPLE